MFRNNHPEARRQQQPVTPHPPGGQVQEQGPGQRRDITIDWADRLIYPRRDTRLNSKWEGLKATLRPTGLCRRTRHKVAQHHRPPHHHSWPRLHGGPSASGAQDSALLASRCSCNHSACAAGSTAAAYRYADSVHPPAALANKPMAAQVVPALCASSFRLCSSCSHTRPCIWRPSLVHELCHTAALRHFHESTTLHLSA
jgi:hypothetical protein